MLRSTCKARLEARTTEMQPIPDSLFSPGRRRINPPSMGSRPLHTFSGHFRHLGGDAQLSGGRGQATIERHQRDTEPTNNREMQRVGYSQREIKSADKHSGNRISAAYISAGRVIAARHTSKSDKDAAPTLASRRPVRTSRDSAEATSAAAKSLIHGSCWTLDMKASTAALAGSLTRIGIMTLASRYQLKDCRSRRADPKSRPK